MKNEIECSLRHCQLPATYRTSTTFKHLYECSKGHTTATPNTMLEMLPRARETDVETSHQAAASIADQAGSQRERILLELEREGGPLTADQLDDFIGWRLTTAGRRLPELREMGRVRMLERTAMTRSGRRARLWGRCSDG